MGGLLEVMKFGWLIKFYDMEINERLGCLEKKIDNIMVALMGSELTKDGGLIGRVHDIEVKFDLKVKSDEQFRNNLVRLFWFAFGIGCGSGVLSTYLFTILKHMI